MGFFHTLLKQTKRKKDDCKYTHKVFNLETKQPKTTTTTKFINYFRRITNKQGLSRIRNLFFV